MKNVLQSIGSLVVGTAAYLLLVFIVCHRSGYANCFQELLGFTSFRKDFGIASFVYFIGLAFLAFTIHSLFTRNASLLRRWLAVASAFLVLFGAFFVLLFLEVQIDKLGP
jgi:hypothetical protein